MCIVLVLSQLVRKVSRKCVDTAAAGVHQCRRRRGGVIACDQRNEEVCCYGERSGVRFSARFMSTVWGCLCFLLVRSGRDSEDVENLLFVLVDSLSHAFPPQEFQACIYRRNARPVAYLHRWSGSGSHGASSFRCPFSSFGVVRSHWVVGSQRRSTDNWLPVWQKFCIRGYVCIRGVLLIIVCVCKPNLLRTMFLD